MLKKDKYMQKRKYKGVKQPLTGGILIVLNEVHYFI